MYLYNKSKFIIKWLLGTSQEGKARTIIRLALLICIISFFIIFLSIFVLEGFKEEVQKKVYLALGTHAVIPYGEWWSNSFFDRSAIEDIEFDHPEVKVFPYLLWAGMLRPKYSEWSHPVILKGVENNYINSFLEEFKSKENKRLESTWQEPCIYISKNLAQKLQITIGDTIFLFTYFQHQKIRKVVLCGLFQTNIENVDKNIALIGHNYLCKVLGLDTSQISGLSIQANPPHKDISVKGLMPTFRFVHISEIYPQVFAWLTTLNTNILFLETVLGIVIIFNVLCLGITIFFSRIREIAYLNAIGFVKKKITGLFGIIPISIIIFLIFSGLVAFVLSTLFAVGQNLFKIVKLDPSIYFIDFVPLKITYLAIFSVIPIILLSWIAIFSLHLFLKKIPLARVLRFE